MKNIDITIKQSDGSYVTANTSMIEEDVIRARMGLDLKTDGIEEMTKYGKYKLWGDLL